MKYNEPRPEQQILSKTEKQPITVMWTTFSAWSSWAVAVTLLTSSCKLRLESMSCCWSRETGKLTFSKIRETAVINCSCSKSQELAELAKVAEEEEEEDAE